MSLSKYKLWQPPSKNLRGRELAFVNSIYNAHDCFCGCEDTSSHLLALLFYPMGLPRDQTIEQAINKIQNNLQTKCLTFGEDAGDAARIDTETTGPDILDSIDPGDLEELFAENGDDDAIDG